MPTEPPRQPPGPADLRTLAARAEQLAAEITTTRTWLAATTATDTTRRPTLRLDTAATQARQAAHELAAAATDLAQARPSSTGDADRGA